MSIPAQPALEPGRVYRTRDLRMWSTNTPRLAKRLVKEGTLIRLAHGLFAHLKHGRFGTVPPSDSELMRAFLDGGSFIFTGPERWNALGLGTTALFSAPLVYNTKRSGIFKLGERRFILRRVAFPESPSPEWFAVDLLENAEQVGASRYDIALAIKRAVQRGIFDPKQLHLMVMQYGTHASQALLSDQVNE